MSYKRNSPIPVVEGGTGLVTSTTAYAPICGGTTATGAFQAASTGLSTSGYVLTSNGASALPSFQALPAGGITTINGNSGSVTGTTITLTGSTSGAVFTGSGSTMTQSFNYLSLPSTTATDGQIRINNSRFLHGYGSLNTFVGNNTGNFTLTGGNNVGIGASALTSVTSGAQNTIIGVAAGDAITSTSDNTAVGYAAMSALTTVGVRNVAIGHSSMASATDGDDNVAIGWNSMASNQGGDQSVAIGSQSLDAQTTGTRNTAVGFASLTTLSTSVDNIGVGYSSLAAVSTGNGCNVGIGSSAGQSITIGDYNTAIGHQVLSSLNTGTQNCAMGRLGLSNVTTGANNIGIGEQVGSAYTTSESSNILFNSAGVIGESNRLRIGLSTGTGTKQLNASFIHGIRGITTGVNDAIAVLIDSAGQLGTVSSSIRYKENVVDMGEVSSPVLNLRPVTFDFIGKPSHKKQVGLIAEEVEQIMPSLVAYNSEGEVESVKYHDLSVLLLNELQKLNKRIEDLEQKLK